ncbi:MAG: hypothetical protein AAF630_13420 [Cyanobacteria bacterium P01_C01_bin.38]
MSEVLNLWQFFYQLPITNYQSPITNYQLPITNYQSPIPHALCPITYLFRFLLITCSRTC